MFYNPRSTRHLSRPFAQTSFQNGYNGWSYQPQHYCTPEANVLELDDRFLLEVSLPGVVLDDVELKAEEHYIVVRAKRLPSPFEEEAIVHSQEMPFTYLIRTFEFHMPLFCEQVEARMDRGILYVSVPKMEIAHRIPVLAGPVEHHLPGLKSTVIGKNETVRQQAKEAQQVK